MGRKNLIIIGASGHGKVLLDMALLSGYSVLGFLDDNENVKENGGYPVLGKVDMAPYCAEKYGQSIEFVLGIGSNAIRKKLDEQYNLPWATLIHPRAIIGSNVEIGKGTVVMANAVVNPSATVGRHCILNTGCIVEHDNRIEDYVHISPGAVLAGTVTVGTESHVGVGAVVKNNIVIGSQVTLGSGAVAVKDITGPGIYAGVPAKKLKD